MSTIPTIIYKKIKRGKKIEIKKNIAFIYEDAAPSLRRNKRINLSAGVSKNIVFVDT
jgi:hypothetical protein